MHSAGGASHLDLVKEITEVAVIPMPDPIMGERVCAYIQPKANTKLSFDGVISFMRDQKASVLQLPERIEFVKFMPYTDAEKIDKRSLREDIEQKLESEA